MIKFLFIPWPVAVGLQIPSLMMNVDVPSSHYVPMNEQLSAWSSCWIILSQLSLLGEMHVKNTSIYFIINGPPSGDNEWIVSEINHIVCGHHSMRWVLACYSNLMHPLFISFLIRKLLIFVLLKLELSHLCSLQFLQDVSYGYFRRSLNMND